MEIVDVYIRNFSSPFLQSKRFVKFERSFLLFVGFTHCCATH